MTIYEITARRADTIMPPDSIAVVGAGVVGCAVANALAAEGHHVLLLDRAPPASAGASFGNVGHIATEQVETLPSKQLLLGFWRELFVVGGPLDIPPRRLGSLWPWLARFVVAAFRQEANTRHLEPLVRAAAASLEHALDGIGRRDLLRRNGHYAVWLGNGSFAKARRAAASAARLAIRTAVAPPDLLRSISAATSCATVTGLWYPDSGHVVDPAEVARALAKAAVDRGTVVLQTEVRHLLPVGNAIEITTATDRLTVNTAVVCAGAWSAPLLAPFGLRVPLEAERGYHVELPGHAPFADAPVLYADAKIAVTPLAGRLRASSYLELAGLAAPADPRKPARLRARLRSLGYDCAPEGPSWMGPRPTLPDYLPGIGRVPQGPRLFYAVGHQHLGLTLATVTAELITDLVAERNPRFAVAALDLRRFGA
jgi:D-amino-acid dehydrogenase